MLTRRGRLALALGIGVYVGAWAFGATTLYPAAVGLVLATGVGWLWVRILHRPMTLERVSWGAEHVEGEDVPVVLELRHEGAIRPRSLPLSDRVAGLGEFDATLRRRGAVLGGRYVIPRVPRGRYAFETTRAVLEDPFGLARLEVPLESGGALLVYPRLVELGHLFTDTGAHARDGRRLLLHRPTGFDLHSVREYEEGESLRRVHWRSTARRGRLMVKELEDSPRDEVAVLLDAAAGVAGAPPDSSFDMQVRAAGSILRAHARRGRRCVLVVNTLGRDERGIRGGDGEWRRALELLAAVQPDEGAPAAALLGDHAGPAGRALELTVVTARLQPQLVERLLHRALSRRRVGVVYVDAASFARPGRSAPEPALVRLQAAGVPVAVLRRGDDLAAKLGGGTLLEAAGG